MKKFISLVLCGILLLSFCACSDDKEETKTTSTGTAEAGETVMIEMVIEKFGTIKLELYPDVAPITVENFVSLAKDGFYDGLTFHRVYPGFMIQGGDPDGNGTGGSAKTIKGEFAVNGVNNTLSHTKGVISMARSQSYNSASSQFFICHDDATFLDGQYAAFGKVVEGMEVVDAITEIELLPNGESVNTKPADPPVIKSVKVIEE